MSGDMLGGHSLGRGATWGWHRVGRVGNAAEHPTMHMPEPKTKNNLAPNAPPERS